jgi:hypothetical protein
MRKTGLLLAALAGSTACTPRANDAGMCLGLRSDVAALRAALEANPAMPGPVGEAGADVVIGFEGGCRAG